MPVSERGRWGQCCSKLQESKAHIFLAKLSPNVDTQDLLGLQQYQPIASWKAMKSQQWTWPATSRPCPDPESQQSNKNKQSMARGKWVSIVQPVAKRSRLLASNKIPKQLLVRVSQSWPRGKTHGSWIMNKNLPNF